MSPFSKNVVRVQRSAFDPGAEINDFLATVPRSGGVATFIGQVRDFKSTGETVHAMTLEHYPGMAERELETLVANAVERWTLDGALVIHRYGELHPGEAIVLVAAASAHRGDAFAACEFLMDWLKTKAPFWKKEATADGSSWVNASAGDEARAERWKE
jgi:molybdopterin synthase catalytic subunit